MHEAGACGNAEACVMCCVYRAPGDTDLWRVNALGIPCKGTARDYRPILSKLQDLGYPRNVSMRNQVPPLLLSMQRELQIDRPVKSARVLVDEGGTLELSYAVEVFGPHNVEQREGAGFVERIAKPSFQQAVAKALSASGGVRFTEEHLQLHPASRKALAHLLVELSWEYPGIPSGGQPRPTKSGTSVIAAATALLTGAGPPADALPISPKKEDAPAAPGKSLLARVLDTKKTEAPKPSNGSNAAPAAAAAAAAASEKGEKGEKGIPNRSGKQDDGKKKDSRSDSSNYLDGTCLVFEEQGLREVVDYRGPNGVRLVSGGVLDFRGVWMGHVGIGDATAGAVQHMGEELDDKACTGKHMIEMRFQSLPKTATDLFFVFSSSTKHDAEKYGTLSMSLRDAENKGHLIASYTAKASKSAKSLVMCSLSKAKESTEWTMETFGTTCNGNAYDYRPVLLCLRAIQEVKYDKLPQWPCLKRVNPSEAAAQRKALLLPRLPDPPRHRHSTASQDMDHYASEDSRASVGSKGKKEAADEVVLPALQESQRTISKGSEGSRTALLRGGSTSSTFTE